MNDTPARGLRPKLIDVAQLTGKERIARAEAAAVASAAARTIVPSDAPTALLCLMAQGHREQLASLLDEANSGRVDLCINAYDLFDIASSLSDIEDELASRKSIRPA